MGDYHDPASERRESEWSQQGTGSQESAAKSGPSASQAQFAFHNQFEYLTQPQRHPNSPGYSQYGSSAFDMAAMAGALPQSAHMNMSQRSQYDTDAPTVFSPASVYQMHQAAQFPTSRGQQADPNILRVQTQAQVAPSYQMGHAQHQMTHRQPGLVLQPPIQYPRMDMYGYGMGAPQFSPLDPRFGPQAFTVGGPMVADMIIVGERRAREATELTAHSEDHIAASPDVRKAPEKYFIVKSLTVQDLEASVRNGTWATQSHNEQTLNAAFDAAENVYLIFSANKSGEYFGYARMASRISGEPVNLNSSSDADEAKLSGTPQSISTPATESAPKGRIIDDSARGTIFWEAELSDNDGESPVAEDGEGGDGQHWGRQFQIEWVSTSRLPFFRTRGLRNPWNANREIKIARDGTELEPSVGRRLVQMFQWPPPTHGSGVMPLTPHR
ncbi:hypothetical protein LTR65_002182 [Meristemomyces frigidus]